jgi:hypothetical protein
VTFEVSGIVDRDDVRMLQRHHELRLAREPLAEALVPRQRRRDELERDRPLQAQVVGAIDDTHSAAADQLLDPVSEEIGSDVDRCGDVHARALATLRLPLSRA